MYTLNWLIRIVHGGPMKGGIPMSNRSERAALGARAKKISDDGRYTTPSARADDVHREMIRRVRRVLHIAALHGHTALVLGAWGCGVFRNDPAHIAEAFRAALTTTYAGRFTRVTFAVLDRGDDRRFIGPFERMFA